MKFNSSPRVCTRRSLPVSGAAMRRCLLLLAVLCGLPSLVAQTLFTPLPYFSRPAEANAITRDGSKAVGYSYSGTANAGNAACWWTSAGIAAVPGQLNWYDTSACGISADGNVIVGEGNSTLGTQFAWYWTPQVGQLQQVPVPGTPYNAAARGVTGDGKVVVQVTDTCTGQGPFFPFVPLCSTGCRQ